MRLSESAVKEQTLGSGSSAAAGALMLAMARREIDCIDRALGSGRLLGSSVHEARKGIRRLRSLLQLSQETFDSDSAAEYRLKALGDSLSVLRDAEVSVETADWMAKRRGRGDWKLVIDRLAERRQKIVAAAVSKDSGFRRRRDRLAKVGVALDSLTWEEVSEASIRRAIKASEKRVSKAERQANKWPVADNLHRWRRRLRRLRMQLEIAAELLPNTAAAAPGPRYRGRAKSIHLLTDELGRRQDLQVLLNLLRSLGDIPEKQALLAEIRAELAQLHAG